MRQKLSILFFFLLSYSFIGAVDIENIEHGLFIKSFPAKDDEKTSLVLENNKPIKLKKETTLSFDILFRKENPFGMIFRIITNQNENIDLYITAGDDGLHYPMLLINESIYLMANDLIYEEWHPISLSFSASKKEISLTYRSSTRSIPYPVSEISEIQVSFGLCPFSNYTIYDIASVNIRNVKLTNDNKVFRYWKLDKHEDSISYDSIANVAAVAKNPEWIIDDYSSWKKFYTKQVKDASLFTFDNEEEKLFIIPRDQQQTIIIYDIKENQETVLQTKNSHLLKTDFCRLLYDNLRKMLVVYNQETKAIYTLSLNDLTWNFNNKDLRPELGFNDSSTTFDANDSTLISFGGYGYLKYNNVLMHLNVYNDSVIEIPIANLSPRLHVSTLKRGNTLYLFSGKGSNTGRQEIFPKYYYDFYSLDLTTNKAQKLWELKDTGYEFYVGENMIYDEQEGCFYTLADIDNLTLLKIREDKEGYEAMSFFREEIYPIANYRNLYHKNGQKSFYAVTATDLDSLEKRREINIYSLNYPPIKLNTATTADETNKEHFPWLWISIVGVIVLGSSIVLILKTKKSISLKITQNKRIKASSSEIENQNEEKYYNFSKQSISLLGGFSIIDKKEENITKLFSPTLRDILVLLILYSGKGGKGISSKELINLFWYDKNEDAAKNNRNVYFSRLRSVLETVGDIEIISMLNFWKIQLKDGILCDYIEAVKTLDLIKNQDTQIETSKINKLLEILNRGVLLPEIEIEWMDDFKRNFSNQVIDILTEISQNEDYQLSDKLKLKIADILFMHDYLNEEALYLRCSIFINSGKKGIARNVYENFYKEYSDLLGSKYMYSLSDVLNRKNIT